MRFSENSSPFDLLTFSSYDHSYDQEDILAGVADEASCYYSEDSSDNDNELVNQKQEKEDSSQDTLTVNNTSLNILRIIGRYLKMCRLLYAISAHIIYSVRSIVQFYSSSNAFNGS